MVNYDAKKFVEILEKIKNTYSSLNEMARKSNVTSSYLSKIMAFRYEEPPSPKILKSIAENSHNITSYMDLMYICGYIDTKDIFYHYNKVFNTNNVISAVKKSEIFNADDIEERTTNYLYDKIMDISVENQEKFFSEIEKKSNTTYKNMIEKVKQDIIEDGNPIPIIEDFTDNMIVTKNNKLKLSYKKEEVKHFLFFSNEYIKKEYNYMCLEIKDNSMNLIFNKQDFVLIQLQETLKDGDIGLLIINNKPFIRKYYKENEYIFLETLSNNENYITKIYNTKNDTIKILGKVIAYQGKI